MHRTISWIGGIVGIALFFQYEMAYSQEINLGTPPVYNFSKQKFGAGTQTWDVSVDERGIIWFANNGGLLEFDGTHWRLHPLPNGTIVRSARTSNDGNVYVGGQDDFGYFSPDARGVMHYHSLKPELPDAEQHFGDVWDVEVLPGKGVFFRADHQVYRLHDRQVTALFPSGTSLAFMGMWGQRLLVQDSQGRFWVFEDSQFRPLDRPAEFHHGIISAVLVGANDTMLITTIKDGIFYFDGNAFQPWQTNGDLFLKNNRILCAVTLPGYHMALGTALNGLVTLDAQRRIYQHLNKKSGLQNNTVLGLLASPNGGVWLGLDNGIDFVNLASPFSAFYPDGDLQGTGYAIQVHGGKIYFGTNTGLYAADWKKYYGLDERSQFSRVHNSDGQVWSLTTLDGDLLMGHHEGAFAVEGLTARSLTRLQGIWRFVEQAPRHAVAGYYNGFALFTKSNGGWRYDTVLSGFSESSRLLAPGPEGSIWMAHPYRGIFNVMVDLSGKSVRSEIFQSQQGLPSDQGNHLFHLGNKTVFTGKKGVFDYDLQQQRFMPNKKFSQIFGDNTAVMYLQQDNNGNIWYETDKETGVLLIENDALEKKIRPLPIPELRNKLVRGFQCIVPTDAQNAFIATTQGFIRFNLEKYLQQDSMPIRLVLHEIRLKNSKDSLILASYPGKSGADLPKIRLLPDQNTLAFSFSCPDYPGGDFVEYAYYLEGLGQEWSEWSYVTEVVFNHLAPGDYVFRVKARNQHGKESPELRMPFRIRPPWYASQAAYISYVLLLIGLVIWLLMRQQNRFEKEKQSLQSLHRRREELHQQHVRRSEEVISQLQKEKLEAEIAHKAGELASVTMHLVQKNTILQSMAEALEKLRTKVHKSPDLDKEVGRILKMIESDANLDADWEHFSQNFDQVHRDFLHRLVDKYPNLSPIDFKLCAYLRMNLTSKEIASLMNISVRGVEAGRYRLRKRMNLSTDTNLTEFLMKF